MITNEEILKFVNQRFGYFVDKSVTRKRILSLIESETVSQADIFSWAQSIGTDLSKALLEGLTTENLGSEFIGRDIAELIINSMFEKSHGKFNDVAIAAQKIIDAKTGIGLNAVGGSYNSDRARGIITAICKDGISPEGQRELLKEPVVTNCLKYFDDFVKSNAQFRYESGLSPKIIRTPARACCKWCQNLAGIYDYEKVKDTGNDVFRRHENCPCTVTFVTERSAQNVWSKRKLWQADEETLETRKKIGLK